MSTHHPFINGGTGVCAKGDCEEPIDHPNHQGTEHPAKWYRDIGDQYAAIAAASANSRVKQANAGEASKYYGIAARLEQEA